MKISANLGVKDEIEIVQRTINHLRAIGVDLIIAFDMGSTDGTAEFLKSQQSRNDFWLIQMSDRNPDDNLHDVWLRRNFEMAQEAGADWAIFLDADEFWIPATSSVRDCAGLELLDVLTVDRFNVALGQTGVAMPETLAPEQYRELLMFVEPIPDFRAHMEQWPDTPWSRGVPMPKIMVRPQRIGALTQGIHNVVAAEGQVLRRRVPNDLLIAHLPFTTAARFFRKARNTADFFATHDKYFTGHAAWHWRRWAALSDSKKINEEFQRQKFDDATIRAFRERKVIRSAAEVFETRRCAIRNGPKA